MLVKFIFGPLFAVNLSQRYIIKMLIFLRDFDFIFQIFVNLSNI